MHITWIYLHTVYLILVFFQYTYINLLLIWLTFDRAFWVRTHGGREDDDPQDVHALAGTGDDFILDVRGRGDLQEDRVAQFRVVVVGHDVDVVGLRLLCVSALYYGDQVRSVLEWK